MQLAFCPTTSALKGRCQLFLYLVDGHDKKVNAKLGVVLRDGTRKEKKMTKEYAKNDRTGYGIPLASTNTLPSTNVFVYVTFLDS